MYQNIGHIERNFMHGDGCFNFITPDKLDGRPFTIGFSCLFSIEIVKESQESLEKEVSNNFIKQSFNL